MRELCLFCIQLLFNRCTTMPKKRKSPQPWNLAQKLIFRFFFIYFAINLFPFPLDYIPGAEFLFQYYDKMWESITPWVGQSVLGLDYRFSGEPTGSGDRTHDYVRIFLCLLIALLGTIFWSIRNQKTEHEKLYKWFNVYIRYFLAFTLLSFGFSRVFPDQFPDPWLYRYVETYGNLSPMGLIVSFLGHSSEYVVFTGLVQVLAGTLLIFRRTATIGALIAIGFLSNLLTLYFAYDVPMKLFTAMLLFQGFIVLASDWQRLSSVFLFNRDSQKVDQSVAISDPKWKKPMLIAKIIIIGYVYYSFIDHGISNTLTWEPRPKLYGLYDVEVYRKNGGNLPPLTTNPERWRSLTIDKTNAGVIRMMNDDLLKTRLKIDTLKQTLKIFPRITRDSLVFKYIEKPADSILILKGKYRNNFLYLKLNKLNIEKFRVRRKFQWVHERPYDR